MVSTTKIAEIASLIGDPARAAMLAGLMDGRALSAAELAATAGVTPQTASSHLSRLVDAGLLGVERQGRHRYHRLASPDVARMLEGIMQLASGLAPTRPVMVGPRDSALRAARTCYDHLAGRLGVAIADSLVAGGQVDFEAEGGIVTDRGLALFRGLGIEPDTGRRRRVLCRPCLDWSERRPHLAGALGAALCAHCFDHGWIRRATATRAVDITPLGLRMFRETFGLREA